MRFYLKTARRKKYDTAIAAPALKLLYIMWFIPINNEGFHDSGTQVGE
jgi:hypothetical protein